MRKAVAVLGLFVAVSVYAARPELVFDIRTTPQPEDSDPSRFFSTGGVAYFFAYDGGGAALWSTDGTEAGTRILADLTPGGDPSEPGGEVGGFVASGDLVWFWSTDLFEEDVELWRTDGTREGTFRVARDLGYRAYSLAPIGTRGVVAQSSEKLLSSDGTVAGTHEIDLDLPFVLGGSSFGGLVPFRGHVYFVDGVSLWRTDGTAEGTERAGSLGEDVDDVTEIVPGDDALYLVADSHSTWEKQYVLRSDGGAPAIVATYDVPPNDAPRLVASRGTVYAFVGAGENLTAMWRLSATPQRMTIVEGATDSYTFLEASGGSIYFETENPARLWRTDGTAAGTRVFEGIDALSDLYPAGSRVFSLKGDGLYVSDGTTGAKLTAYQPRTWNDGAAELNGGLVVAITDPEHGAELWFSNGTPQGTRLLKNIRPDRNSRADLLRRAGSNLLFRAYTEAEGYEPWVSDGTLFGTRLLADVERGTWSSMPHAITPLANGRTVFVASNLLYGTNGNLTELLRITDDPIYVGEEWTHDPLPVIDGRAWVVFSGNDGSEIWTTDGTRAGTTKLIGLGSRRTGFPLLAANGLLFYVAGDALWRTDGTSDGTFAVASNPEQIHAAGKKVFFTSHTAAHGRELWVTDGTLGGTHIVKDIRRGEDGAFPFEFPYDESVTVMQSAGDVLFFSADDGVHGLEPWRSDGTEAGTFLLGDLAPGPASSMLPRFERNLTAYAGGSVFFAADDGVHGHELWRSDLRGAELVRDISPGPTSSYPTSLNAVGEMIYLAADDGRHGRELWWATAGGAGLTADVNPGGDSSHPREMTELDGWIYFFAATDATGDELWRVEPPTVRRRAVR